MTQQLDPPQDLPARWAVHQLAVSPLLRQRRFQLLPLRGVGTPFTDVQGRTPGDSTAPVDLADLISSIATVGVLQPVLVEEIANPQGAAPTMKLAAGERRLRAVRWGAVHLPDNDHFACLPAVVCPGPLSEEERRVWQLIENVARQPLRPGELAAALVLHRCAVMVGKLLSAGKPVPADIYGIADPTARFDALQRLRGSDSSCSAPWAEVLHRLGLQLTPRDARQLVQAFREMPPEISEEMDEAKIRLNTRLRFLALRQGRAQAAEGIWTAVKARGRPDLLPAALTAAAAIPAELEVDPDTVLGAAERSHEQANAARAAKLRRKPEPTAESAALPDTDLAATAPPGYEADSSTPHNPVMPPEHAPAVESRLVAAALAGLRGLVGAVSAGAHLSEHDHASLRLLVDQLTTSPAA